MSRIYLDYNATSPLVLPAQEAMLLWLGRPTNPMSAHLDGRTAAIAIDKARQQVADLAGWPRNTVYFTSGATEANATILHHLRWATSAVEHPSVKTWATTLLPVDADGRCWPQDPGPVDGISIQLANNETGVLQPIDEWAHYCKAHNLLFHIDAAQGPGRIPLPQECDFMTLSAHKCGGPQGVGALLARHDFAPLLGGGPQERTKRPGTHNVAGIVSFGSAITNLASYPVALRDRLQAGLKALGGRIAAENAERLPNTVCVGFDGIDAQDLVIALDLEGIACSAGSACSSGSTEPSHVLKAMGFSGTAARFSLGPTTTPDEIERTLAVLARLVPALTSPINEDW